MVVPLSRVTVSQDANTWVHFRKHREGFIALQDEAVRLSSEVDPEEPARRAPLDEDRVWASDSKNSLARVDKQRFLTGQFSAGFVTFCGSVMFKIQH